MAKATGTTIPIAGTTIDASGGGVVITPAEPQQPIDPTIKVYWGTGTIGKVNDRDEGNLAKALADPNVHFVQSWWTWAELEDDAGNLVVDALDAWLDRIAAAGKRAVIVWMGVNGKMPGSINTATPKRVLDSVPCLGGGMFGTTFVDRYPEFWAVEWLNALKAHLAKLAQYLGADPRVEMICVGGYGIETREPSFYNRVGELLQATLAAPPYNFEYRGKRPVLTWSGLYGTAIASILNLWRAAFPRKTLGCVVRIPQGDDGTAVDLNESMITYAGARRMVLMTTNLSPSSAGGAQAQIRERMAGWAAANQIGAWADVDDQDGVTAESVVDLGWQATGHGSPGNPYFPLSRASYVTFGPSHWKYTTEIAAINARLLSVVEDESAVGELARRIADMSRATTAPLTELQIATAIAESGIAQGAKVQHA